MNIIKKIISKNVRKAINIIHQDRIYDSKLLSEYEIFKKNGKILVLGVTSGRSGTRWLADIFSAHKNAVGSCERNVIAESFYRYVKWNKLAIDVQGIIDITKFDIIKDWQKVDISLVVSPYFSHDLINLVDNLIVDKIIWGINDPRFTITTFYNKGIYSGENIRGDKNLVYGFQPEFKDKWNHFFGRLIPKGEFYDEWKALTRIGKISWYLNTFNKEAYSIIKQIPKEKVWIFKLEEADQNYDYYLKMAEEFGLRPLLSKKKFLSLKGKAVFKGENIPKVWSKKEEEEFEKYAYDYIKIYKEL